MYNIPADIDLNEFNGAVIQQICFTLNSISLLLDTERYVSFEGEFILSNNDKDEKKYEVFPITTDKSDILNLLEQTIDNIIIERAKNALSILFSNGFRLTLLSSENYESYIIKTSKDFIRI